MGGVIAAAYASGMTVEEIKAIADEYSDTRTLMHLADPTIPRRGLFKGEQLEAFFRRHIRNYNFIESGRLKAGTPFVTRKAPAAGSNPGGGIEVVVPNRGVRLLYFSLVDKVK